MEITSKKQSIRKEKSKEGSERKHTNNLHKRHQHINHGALLPWSLYRADGWMKYCDQHVCLSVCPLAYLKTTSKFHKPYMYMLPVASDNTVLCTSSFVDDVTYSHNGANRSNQARRCFVKSARW